MKSLCVFCGARFGNNPRYQEDAIKLGQLFAQNKIRLVYGGGDVGLMGVVATSVMNAGGEGIGVIPKGLFDHEIAHKALTQLHVTEDMHTRKAKMAEMADGFIALPGGFGTLDELCEIITWAQLGIHKKKIVLLNTENFWSGFLDFVWTCTNEGFISEKDLFKVVQTPEEAVAYFQDQ